MRRVKLEMESELFATSKPTRARPPFSVSTCPVPDDTYYDVPH
jgi:hypothetical protein